MNGVDSPVAGRFVPQRFGVVPRTLGEIHSELLALQRYEQQLLQESVRVATRCSELLTLSITLSEQQKSIHRLPPELLLRVFSLAIALDRSSPACSLKTNLLWGPIELSAVCRRWRLLILDTSALWTAIYVPDSSILSGRTLLFVERSKSQLLDLVFIEDFKPDGEKHSLIKLMVIVSKRLRCLRFTASQSWDVIRHLLRCTASQWFFALQDLELNFHKDSPFHKSLMDATVKSFPVLQNLRVGGRCPFYHLGQVSMPELKMLSVSWQHDIVTPGTHITADSRSSDVSHLHAFLAKNPGLEQVHLLYGIGAADVILLDPMGDASANIQDGRKLISPVDLPKLHTFSWTHAPPKDAWRLFVILRMPNLVSLDLIVSSVENRWMVIVGDRLASPSTLSPASLGYFPSVIQLGYLESLSLECSDYHGLCLAIKRIDFPNLRSLSISYNGGAAASEPFPESTCILPPPEKLLYEPRLIKLTRLVLRNFIVELQNTTEVLSYLQSLEMLSLTNCDGAGAVVCALARGECCGRSMDIPTHWICPALLEIEIIESNCIQFQCLKIMARLRKTYSEIASHRLQTPRPIKPLRRTVFGQSASANAGNLPGSATPRTPKKASGAQAEDQAPASPNGSFVEGWRAHEISRPRKLRAIYLKDCPHVSREQLDSLIGDVYGLEEVSWSCSTD